MLVYSVNPDEATERALDRNSRIAVNKALRALSTLAKSIPTLLVFILCC